VTVLRATGQPISTVVGRLREDALGATSSDDATDGLPADAEPPRSFRMSAIYLYCAKDFSLALGQSEFGSLRIVPIG
jgi:hypothetical protein